MPHRTHPMAVFALALLLACGADDEPDVVTGDAAEQVAAIDPEDLPTHARALLESERPWRASMVMRRSLA